MMDKVIVKTSFVQEVAGLLADGNELIIKSVRLLDEAVYIELVIQNFDGLQLRSIGRSISASEIRKAGPDAAWTEALRYLRWQFKREKR